MNRGISDELILKWIQNKVLFLSESNEVYKFNNAYLRYVKLKPVFHWKSGRKQYALRTTTAYRKIGANKLLWMLVRNQVVPEGFDVDHIDKNRFNDDPENLRLRDSMDNQCDNISAAQLQGAMDFFDGVGFCASTCKGVTQ